MHAIAHMSVRTRQIIFFIIAAILIATLGILNFFQQTEITARQQKEAALSKKLSAIDKELKDLQSQDQVLINKKQDEEIKNIQTTYKKTVESYESLLDLKVISKTSDDTFDKLLALSLKQLSDKNYASAEATLAQLNTKMQIERQKTATPIASSGGGSANIASIPANNNAPGSGYSRQRVKTDIGEFAVDIVAADMGSTRVIVDSASDSDCRDNCPVLSLGDYVSRNGAFAGINGSYFCPAAYPSCAGKTNSFDTLLMNKNKKYLNSDNNVYSNVPAVIFLNGSMRFVGASSEWGRDTSPNGVLANQPLVLSGGNVAFGGDGDPKKGSRGSRSFVGNKGSTAYIGVVHNATVAEVGHVLKAMGLDGALNLDSGGSTALWSGGYKVGPGRNIPNAILFVR
jgi:hypothetical protein